jgi:UDP-N-acetylmuramyl pentapeptide phosphotransferase/UDP-N-acetylglucosamine-1-phosphate transferase
MSFMLGALAFFSAALLARSLCRPGSKLYILDHPNRRSLHESPTPRGGGLAIFVAIVICGTIAAVLYGTSSDLLWLGIAALMIAGVSFLDDWLTIHLGYRIVVHFFAAYVIVRRELSLESFSLPGMVWSFPEPVTIVISLLFIVWMINLYNFMDGMDGLAAGMAVLGFGSFALLGWLAGDTRFMALNLIVAAAAGGFLVFNFPPAKIFMGDLGSSLLGFLAAAFALWAQRDDLFPLWVGVLIFSPLIVDATITLLRRILKREKFWQAHKTHYYQRLVQLGWGHKRTVLWEYALMLLCVISAILVRSVDPTVQWFVLAGWLLLYGGLMFTIQRLEARQVQ